MSRLSLVALLVAGCAGSAPLTGPEASQEDTDAIIAVIQDFFVGFEAADADRMAGHLVPGGRLVITTFDEDGQPQMREIPLDNFPQMIASRQGPAMVETIWNPQVSAHDNLASIWVDYNFWIGDEIDHCGKDNFQLFRSTEGWKIIAVADTQRREGCAPMVNKG